MRFKQTVITTCIILLLAGAGHAQNLEDLSFGTDSTLEVVSWNIEWFPKQGAITLDYVAEIIESIDADIFAIQEIDDRNAFVQLDSELEAYEGYYVPGDYLGLAYLFKPGHVAVNDIYEIFTGNSRQFPRPPLVMEMVFNGKDYIIINNHFKCCGNGALNPSDPWDEETRRLDASTLLKDYIDTYLSGRNVILTGDLNDLLIDNAVNNVFLPFLNEPWNYIFADMEIAQGNSSYWSYPSWPSHLDHILISNELFDDLSNNGSSVKTIQVDEYLAGGFDEYDQFVSDHRPVGVKILPAVYASAAELTIKETSLTCFPNPSNGKIVFSFHPVDRVSTLDITDIQGRVVYKTALSPGESKFSWHPHWLREGIYFARLQSDKSWSSPLKIILAK